MHSQNNNKNKNIQSAGNRNGSSETIRQLSNVDFSNEEWFRPWLAGIIDGDGNFDIRTLNNVRTLKAIRVKMHIRDLHILEVILKYLGFGRINKSKCEPYCIYIVSTKQHMEQLIHLINGLIRLKAPQFQESCSCLNIDYVEANYTIEPFDPYFAGLIDTDGSIVFNYAYNRIECTLEFKHSQYSEQLCLDYVIPNYKPRVFLRTKKNQAKDKQFKSIAFHYSTVKGMPFLYDYFRKNKLFCEIKSYRISKIKSFLDIRHYQKYPAQSEEYQIYCDWALDFIKYLNPSWPQTPFVKKLIR